MIRTASPTLGATRPAVPHFPLPVARSPAIESPNRERAHTFLRLLVIAVRCSSAFVVGVHARLRPAAPPRAHTHVRACAQNRCAAMDTKDAAYANDLIPSSKGLTTAEAQAQTIKWGRNEIPEEKEPLWRMFAMQFVGTLPAMVRMRPAPSTTHRVAMPHTARCPASTVVLCTSFRGSCNR